MNERFLARDQAIRLAMLLLLLNLMAFTTRVNISVAMPFIAEDFGWATRDLGQLGGLLLGIFLLGFGPSNILIGPLVDHFGPRRSILISMAAFSFLTFLTGLLGAFYSIFLGLRLLMGISQGVIAPSASNLTQGWFHPGVRARVNAMFLSSGFIANLLAPLLLIPLIQLTDWETMFYVVAGAGFILMVPMARIVRDPVGPRSPRPSRELVTEMVRDVRVLLSDRRVVLLTIAFTTTSIVWWGLSLWLPTYLEEAKGFSIDDLVWAASLPYIGGIVGMYIGAWLSDRSGRRIGISVAFLVLCSASLIMATTAEGVAAVIMLAMVFFFQGAMPPNVFTILQGMVPPERISGATGFLNGVAMGSGILGTMVIGLFVALSGSYDTGMVLVAMVQFMGAALFLGFGRWYQSAHPG